MHVFGVFKSNTKGLFVVNQSNYFARQLSQNIVQDFCADPQSGAGYIAADFKQEGLAISFTIKNVAFHLNQVGRHNMENALAAVAVANLVGVSLEVCAAALQEYEGIYRRHQVLGKNRFRKKSLFLFLDLN